MIDRIYNYSDDIRHDLEIYEQEQEEMDDYIERLERLKAEAEEMYRTEELGELLCWYNYNGTGDFMNVIAHSLKRRDYERAGRFLGALVDTYAPELAKDYAKEKVE